MLFSWRDWRTASSNTKELGTRRYTCEWEVSIPHGCKRLSPTLKGCKRLSATLKALLCLLTWAQKSFNSSAFSTLIKITIVGLSYFANCSGFSSHSLNGAQNWFELNLNRCFPECKRAVRIPALEVILPPNLKGSLNLFMLPAQAYSYRFL